MFVYSVSDYNNKEKVRNILLEKNTKCVIQGGLP